MIAAGCIGLAAILILALLIPGKTFSFIYVHDMMIFVDGAHRLLDGQLPNRDFHTPLGLIAYILPALGLGLSGSLGGMMPVATALFTLIYLPLLVYVCISRLPLLYAAIFAFFSLALAIGPTSIGEDLPSFAMFYNRWGYALVALLFLLAAPHRSVRPLRWADAAVAGAVLLLCFFLKISYFGVALGFTLLFLLFGQTRSIAIGGICLAAAGIGLVHLFWGGTSYYLQDLGTAAQVSGGFRTSALVLIKMFVRNGAMIVPFAFILALAVYRGVPPRTLFLCVVMTGGGVLLYNQNYQGAGIMTLVPAAMVAAVSAPERNGEAEKAKASGLAMLLLVATLALPPALVAAESIWFHGWMIAKRGYPSQYLAELDGFMTQEVSQPSDGRPGLKEARRAYRSGYADLPLLSLIRNQALRQELAQPEYFWTLEDAARLLRTNPRLAGKVLALDMSNPLNALVSRSGPKGVDSWYHAGRTFNETTFRPPDQTFADVDILMVPKAPVQPDSHTMLAKLYGPYIRDHYQHVATSDYWWAYGRKRPRSVRS